MLEYFYKGDVSIDANDGSSDNPIDLEAVPPSSVTPSSVAPNLITPSSITPSSNPLYFTPSNQQYTQSAQMFFVGLGQNPGLPLGYGNPYNVAQGTNPGTSFVVPNIGYPQMRNAVSNFFDFSNDQPVADAPQTPAAPPVNPQNLITLAAIYIAADKYDVQPLKTLAKTKYESILAAAWNTKQFVESLELIYDGLPEMSEPDMLRDLAIKTAATHAKELMEREEFMTLFQERGDFATDVFKASLQQGQVAATPTPDAGSGIPRCWNNISHAVNGIYAPRVASYPPSPLVLRYKCAVCNHFLD